MVSTERWNREYVDLAKKHGFNPVYLKEIVRLRNMGYNNTQIAELTGISRTTVNEYVQQIRKQDQSEELGKLILMALGLALGAAILSELFNSGR